MAKRLQRVSLSIALKPIHHTAEIFDSPRPNFCSVGTSVSFNQSGAVGVAAPTVQANFTDFSYVALVNQTATNGTGTFNEQGAGFFSSYRFPGLADVLANAGINTNYKLYAAFVADGTVAPTAVEGRLLMIG
jgi:hypothetical protein